MNEGHFRDMLFDHVPPPAVRKNQPAGSQTNGNGATTAAAATGDLMMMGFPTRLPDTSPPTLCACHGIMKSEGYLCSRCLSKVCDIPTDCPVCDLVIVSAPHLARSYHHLFPVKPYDAVYVVYELPFLTSLTFSSRTLHPNEGASLGCNGCGTLFPLTGHGSNHSTSTDGISRYGRYRCPECKKDFCSECDVFVHDVMHVCPSCNA
jgi:transcription initiation factor TFIIH subunit 2